LNPQAFDPWVQHAKKATTDDLIVRCDTSAMVRPAVVKFHASNGPNKNDEYQRGTENAKLENDRPKCMAEKCMTGIRLT